MTDNIKKKLLGKYGENYVRALTFTSSAEGAFANRKADKGGITGVDKSFFCASFKTCSHPRTFG